jgi:large subunit ribosomal protein L31
MKAMKPDIHPKYMETQVSCACGNSFKTHATVATIKVDICNACHPFYTGKQKFVDSAGRVDAFVKKYGGTKAKA